MKEHHNIPTYIKLNNKTTQHNLLNLEKRNYKNSIFAQLNYRGLRIFVTLHWSYDQKFSQSFLYVILYSVLGHQNAFLCSLCYLIIMITFKIHWYILIFIFLISAFYILKIGQLIFILLLISCTSIDRQLFLSLSKDKLR